MRQTSVPIRRYLEELEIAAKQMVGVVPEDAIKDAREHLSIRSTSTCGAGIETVSGFAFCG